MKVGDKLYCRKNYYKDRGSKSLARFHLGDWYEVVDVKQYDDLSTITIQCQYGNCVKFLEKNIYFLSKPEKI